MTEPPEFEAPVAIALVNRYSERKNHKPIPPINEVPKSPYEYSRRESFEIAGIGGDTVPKVFADYSGLGIKDYKDLSETGLNYNAETDKWFMNDISPDILFMGDNRLPFDAPNSLKVVYNYNFWRMLEDKSIGFPYYRYSEYQNAEAKSFILNFVEININDVMDEDFKADDKTVFVIMTDNKHGMAEERRIFFELLNKGIKNPIIIRRDYKEIDEENLRLYSATDLGALLIDGFGDGVWITVHGFNSAKPKEFINRTLFGILQATRTRISKTEYIACPSCGRTLFDLMEVTDKIRKRTEQLKGVKIAIMGCIVNGPGEMADADYGYVGSGIGKITLYRGKEVVERSLNSEYAVDKLIDLIKEDGKWIEPV